jgi:exocyst complex component 5
VSVVGSNSAGATKRLILLHMGEIYLDSALDAAADQALAFESSKTAPEFTYFPSLHSAITILHLLTTSINTVLLPLASPNLSIRRDIEKTTANTTAALEAKIGTILHRTIDAVLAYVSRQLASQKKSDFRPKDDDALTVEVTPTCASVSSFLARTASNATAALSGRNLAIFLAEIAIGLRALLLEHLRKFSVSLTGGLVVSRDVTRYVETVKQWPTGEELEQGAMEVVSDVATLFVIGPEALRERLRAAKGEEKGELRQYILKREDVNTVAIQAVLSAS